jgi:putative acetyltransferase
MAGGVSVRPYRPADAEVLLELFRASVRRVAIRDYTEDQVKAWASDDIDRAGWAERRGNRPTWVAEIDGAVAGFSDLKPDGLLDMMFVHPDHQGRGVARALLRQVEAAARAQGLARLFTDASITARPFFERHGFRMLTPQTVELRGQRFVNYRMEKALA